jgi:Asp-tRNA(Asn)/Glu-tRNA(Gln) amidotransferase A subunit family amidase
VGVVTTSDTVPTIDETGPTGEEPQDRTIDRRWFVSRSAAAVAGGTAVMWAGTRPAAAGDLADNALAYASNVRPEALKDLSELTIAEAAELYRRGKLKPADLMDAYYDRLEKYEDILQAFNDLKSRETVLAEVAALSRRSSRSGALWGTAQAPKDNYYTTDLLTTGQSPVYADFRPGFDATCITRLRGADTIIIGKAQMGPLASGRGVIPGTNIPTCRNAWTPDDIRYNPSGSSGGTATAVAARLATGGIGTQTGGSITSPSTAQNMTGMAPTFGRTSLYGVIPLSYNVDRTGPIARDAKDCAIILQALAGADANDPRTRGLPPVPDFVRAATPVTRRGKVVPRYPTTIGVPPDFLTVTDAQVVALRQTALAQLTGLGYKVVDVTYPDEWALLTGDLAETQNVTGAHYFMDELQKDVAQFGPRLTGFLPYVLRSGAGLLKIQQACVILLHRILTQLFAQCDVAFVNAGNFNRPGLPTISMPIGMGTDTQTGLNVPRGVVIGGAPFGEERLLSIVAAFQAVTDHHLRRPPDPTLPAPAPAPGAMSAFSASAATGSALRDQILAENAKYPVDAIEQAALY